MVARRFAAAALGVVFSLGPSFAQVLPEELSLDPVSNWSAPPYWIPPAASSRAGREPAVQNLGAAPLEALGALPAPLPFFALTPCRIVDTRGAAGPFGGPALVANATRTFDIPTGPCPGIPTDAGAYSLNFTIIGGAGVFTNAFLTAWPTGDTQPVVSTLNFNADQLEANAAVVPAGTSGSINVFVNAPGHLLIDINGYYSSIPIVNTVNSLSGNVTLAEGSNITITPSGNILTIASTGGGSGWSLTGNAGTTSGTNFLGTTDNQALEIKVNGTRALRLEPTAGSPNVIGGDTSNSVAGTIRGATIGGGGAAGFSHEVLDDYGTISGGYDNLVGDGIGTTVDHGYATVGGGYQNTATGLWSTVGGGSSNHANAQHATVGGGGGNNVSQVAGTISGGSNNSASFYAAVAGGFSNNASANAAAIGGGGANTASGLHATIPGGHANTASGTYSLAAGRRAKAINDGAWVWGDSTDADVSSSAANQFIARATGGFTFYPSATVTCTLTDATGWQCANLSDRNLKREIAPVDVRQTLERLLAVPIQTWSYSGQNPPVRHMGPMAQDFAAAYGLGAGDKKINPVDSNGVALAAIQGLYELVKEKDSEIDALKARLSKLEAKME